MRLPPEIITGWLGPDSGWLGVLAATIAGAVTPGGPVVGFSIGAVALKVGGGTPQVIAYVIAWALFAFQRMILWEIPFMPERFVWFRAGSDRRLGPLARVLDFVATAAPGVKEILTVGKVCWEVRESIEGRVRDLGGTASLNTGSFGTEWELVVPRTLGE